jgi:GMP synthase (glutamine-hydrolysing)
MQLLAMSLGATLLLRHGREIGIAPVTYTEAGRNDPVLGPISRCRSIDGEAAPVLHWHSDAVELPSGATLLASTPLTPVQAFRLGSALGLQFHPEVDTELLTTWLDEPTMVQGLSRGHVEEMRESGVRQLPALRPSALLGLQAFVASVNERL